MRWIFLSLFLFTRLIYAWEVDAPFSPEAHQAAQKALELLGAHRGAIAIAPAVSYAIIGLNQNTSSEGLGYAGDVEDVSQLIKDLNAEVREQEIIIDLSGDVLFDFDQWNIKPEAVESLTKIIQIAQKKNAKSITITGYTDSKGNDAYNQTLSEKRALSVKEWLIQNSSLSASIIKSSGAGETNSKAPNTNPDGSDNPEGRAQNRRVEVVILAS